MKQFTRVIHRPENFSEDDWKLELIGIAQDVNNGCLVTQGSGIHSACFVDTSNWTLVITIIQFDHAAQHDITAVHQAITLFIENIPNL